MSEAMGVDDDDDRDAVWLMSTQVAVVVVDLCRDRVSHRVQVRAGGVEGY